MSTTTLRTMNHSQNRVYKSQKHKSSIFILGGDFNLPDIDWKNYTIQGTQTSRDINNAFLEMAANLNIQQLVDKPTRGDNTLDVLFTSHPGQLNRCKTIPPLGNSDHDIVLLDFSHGLQKPKQQKRKIYLWKKANIAMINQHLKEKYNIFKNTDFEDVNSLWTNIKGLILDAINQHVPTRNTLTKHSHPWMNSELRRLSNKKQRAYTLAKSSGKTRDIKKYKFLKSQLQKEARQAHSNYMEDIFEMSNFFRVVQNKPCLNILTGQKMEGSNDVQFETLSDEYSARSFYEHYKDNLPQMVMVTQGYMGEGIFETFDRGQVFRIQTYTKQKRVIALVVSGEKGMYGLQGRQISIPADYDVKFHVLKLGKFKVGKPASLKEILERKELPLDVQFAGDEKVLIGSTARTASFTLTLVNTYEDFYLLGNAICDGKLYDSVTAVPAYLPDLRFSIVKSIKGYSDDQYKTFMSVTDQFVKEHITFDQSFGNTEIALYSNERSPEVESSVVESYAYISPCEYYNIGDLLRHDKPKPATKKGKKGNEKVYDVLRVSKYDNQTYASMDVEQTDTSDLSTSGKKTEESIQTNQIPNTDEKGISDKANTQSETVKKDPPPIPPKPPQSITDKPSIITADTDTVLPPAIDNKTYMSTQKTEEKVDSKDENIISGDTGTLPPATVETKEPVPLTKEQPKGRGQEAEMVDVEFETAKEDYSARSFYEHYKDNLPQMVMGSGF
ncbi:unnamed protein product [Mytilus edulis]|uniref:Endonuclease/exonuclease/phosphatase domain-containing protein n=1 Tax=Mytilus edulis TaxID=6550 RepID=A0A8S3TJU3_MYTED|nr:unnamed protein product [Mytilus edulis]